MTTISEHVRMEVPDAIGSGEWVDPDLDIKVGDLANLAVNGGAGLMLVRLLARHDADADTVVVDMYPGIGDPCPNIVAAADLRPIRTGKFGVIAYDEYGNEEYSVFYSRREALAFAERTNGEFEEI